jgi:hypothetical protein
MNIKSPIYKRHKVFRSLKEYLNFYKHLSFQVMMYITPGTNSLLNIDTYIFSSMQGTIDSITVLIRRGRINDSYALLRKLYDSAIMNIYCILYLENNQNLENYIVDQIQNWIIGKDKLPEFRILSKYIRESDKLKELNKLLYKDANYKKLRDRCNGHTHYNSYKNVLLNDNEINLSDRISQLDQFEEDIRSIFILHCTYLFYLNEHYMSSSDYSDALDCGLEPEEGSQYLVAPFIQSAFDKIISKHRPDLVEVIKEKTCMKLETRTRK